MNKTKATSRNQRAKKSGEVFNANHNFLDKSREKENHINHDKTCENIYYQINSNGDWIPKQSFNANKYELVRYADIFGKGVEARNQKYIKSGHIEDTKTIQQVYTNKKTAPMETILQISNTKDLKNKKFTEEELKQNLNTAAQRTIKKFQQKYKNNLEILDYALHVDEGVPHVHVRYCFKVYNKEFNAVVLNQSKALSEMGFDCPDPTKKRSRYNNPLISFSDTLREEFYQNCERQGFVIDREVVSQSRRQQELHQFKLNAIVAEITEKEEQLKNIDEYIKNHNLDSKLQQLQQDKMFRAICDTPVGRGNDGIDYTLGHIMDAVKSISGKSINDFKMLLSEALECIGNNPPDFIIHAINQIQQIDRSEEQQITYDHHQHHGR